MQPEPTSPVGSDRGVGATLYRAREERGVSVSEVARATRIRPRYLEALENDAPEDDFPGRVYARFFLREYARYLRVPDEPLVEALDARWSDGEPQPEPLAPKLGLAPVREPRRWVGRVITALALVALGILVTISVLNGGSGPRTSPLGPQRPPAAATGSGGAGVAGASGVTGGHLDDGAPPVARSVDARLVASDGRCWVQATSADGRVLFAQTLELGQSTTLHAQRGIELDLGSAGSVRLIVNGKRVPAGEGVVHLSLQLRDGRVVVS